MACVVVTEFGPDPAARAVLRRALESAGHEVHEAACPAPLVADVLVCDLSAAAAGGAASLRTVRRSFPGLPVVALVAGAFDEPANLTAFAQALGASRVVPKPFRLAALLEAVEGATRRA